MSSHPGPQPDATGDHILRAMTDDGAFRVMALRATDTCQAAVIAQQATGPVATQLGELMAAAVLVRETMAPPYRVQTLLRDNNENQVVGDSFPEGRTRGLVRVQDPLLGVQVLDGGYLQVLRSLPGRAPHQGILEIDDDGGVEATVTAYFRQSEQIETMVGLACTTEGDRVVAAGGYVVQLLPEVTDPPLRAMRDRLDLFGELAPQLARHDADPQWLVNTLLQGEEYTALADSPVEFGCNCGAEKAIGAVSVLGADEVRALLTEGKAVAVHCDYCREAYQVGPDDFRRILDGEVS